MILDEITCVDVWIATGLVVRELILKLVRYIVASI